MLQPEPPQYPKEKDALYYKVFTDYCLTTARYLPDDWRLPAFFFDARNYGLRTPRQSFFSKIRNFWAWADKLGQNFRRHLGYIWPNYKHYFGTVSPLSMG